MHARVDCVLTVFIRVALVCSITSVQMCVSLAWQIELRGHMQVEGYVFLAPH